MNDEAPIKRVTQQMSTKQSLVSNIGKPVQRWFLLVTAGAGQAPSKPLSLLQRVAQDAKRKTRGGSPGGLALARELNQAHSIPPAGVLPPPKFQSSTAQPAQPASSASGRDAETSVPVY